MNKAFAQDIYRDEAGDLRIRYDWYEQALPRQLQAEEMAYLDTAYSFTSFHSHQPDGLRFGYASGNYGRSNIMAGPKGRIRIGKYVTLEATNLICYDSITIGDHCMFSWGSVLTDAWVDGAQLPAAAKRKILIDLAATPERLPLFTETRPVVAEDNVWVGFDAVILPGVRLGRGCIIGSKTIVWKDVPPYAVVAGSPARVIRYLEPSDTEAVRQRAIERYTKVF
jgi:acetyltransferase-like isoleucine patch superfamily enzyme